jgi:2-desacetyl-2-hydroxyethyl bacteriochlorophyllide A dehydrogenase
MRRAALMGPRRFELHEVEVPTPGPTQVLVRVAYNGVCGSEFPAYLGLCTGYPYYARKQDYPILTYGHEGVGRVVGTGSEVKDFKVGDRVVGSGGYAEYAVAEACTLTAVPDGISDKHAALCKMAQEAAFVLELIRVTTADRVLITGVGPAGLLILEHLREAGCAEIVCVDAVERRLEMAASLGATAVLKAGEDRLIERIRAACGGGPTIAIDTSGMPQAILTCFDAAASHGQIGLFGRPLHDLPNFRIEEIVHRFLRIIGLKCPAIAYSRDRTLATLRRIKRNVLHADQIVTHEFPLERVGDAFDAAVSKEGLKVVVRCG